MGSYYQPIEYLKGGKRKSTRRNRKHRSKGGFSPSIMGGVVSAGRLLVPVAIKHGMTLLHNNKKRRKTRKMRKNKN